MMPFIAVDAIEKHGSQPASGEALAKAIHALGRSGLSTCIAPMASYHLTRSTVALYEEKNDGRRSG
jgi:hypothetical protein